MQKTILATAIVALAGMNAQTAFAGNNAWSVAGSVFIGGSTSVAIAGAVNSSPSYSVNYSHRARSPCPQLRPAVCAPVAVACPPVVYVRPPIVVYHAPVVCAPLPVVKTRYAHRGGHGHGYSHYRH